MRYSPFSSVGNLLAANPGVSFVILPVIFTVAGVVVSPSICVKVVLYSLSITFGLVASTGDNG